MRQSSGNALLIILITIGLLATLTYTIVNSSRNSDITDTSDIEAEIDTSTTRECSTAVNIAVNMLKSRNECSTSDISYEIAGGYNANPLAPASKKCHVFDPAGGNLTPCGPYAEIDFSCLPTLDVGETCNGLIYAGSYNGKRLYTTLSDQNTSIIWSTISTTTAANSTSNGMANTNQILARTDTTYPAASACRALGTEWYLPAKNELEVLYNNRYTGHLNGTFGDGRVYWSSTETTGNPNVISIVHFSDSPVYGGWSKQTGWNLRCVRSD